MVEGRSVFEPTGRLFLVEGRPLGPRAKSVWLKAFGADEFAGRDPFFTHARLFALRPTKVF